MDREGFFFRRTDHEQWLRRPAKNLGKYEGLGRLLETANDYFSLPAIDKIAELLERILGEGADFKYVPYLLCKFFHLVLA